MTAADEWRWTDDEGVQRLLPGEELRTALRDGRLEPSVLVWRRGMDSWRPAGEVPELSQSSSPPASASTPPPAKRGAQPANMVNMASLAAQQPGPRAQPHAKRIGRAPLASAPRGAMVTQAPTDAKPRTKPRPAAGRGAKPDGMWNTDRADEERTVTTVKPGDSDNGASNDPAERRRQFARTLPRPRKATIPPPTRTPARDTTTDTEVLTEPAVSKRPGALGAPLTAKARVNADASSRVKPVRPKSVPPPMRHRRRTRPPGNGAAASTSQQSSTQHSPVERIERPSKKASSIPPPLKRRPRRPTPPPAAGRPAQKLKESFDPIPARPRSEAPGIATKVSPQPVSTPPPANRGSEPAPGDALLSSEPWQIPKAPKIPAIDPAPTLDLADLVAEEAAAAALPQSKIATVAPPSRQPATPSGLPFGLTQPVLLGVAGGGFLLLLLAFAIGRASAPAEAGMSEALQARTGWAAVPLFARQQSDAAELRPCLMTRAPSRLAGSASQRIPIEMLPLSGGTMAVGYARSIDRARGVMLDVSTGAAKLAFDPEKAEGALTRVVPLPDGDTARFGATLKESGDLLNPVYLPAAEPFLLAFNGQQQLVRAAKPGASSATVFKLSAGKSTPDAIRAAKLASGYALTFRHGRDIAVASVGDTGSEATAPTTVWTSTRVVGRPAVGYNGREVLVTFADLAKSAKGAVVMFSRGKLGEGLPKASKLDLPEGGPGTSASSPAVAGLADGRWLLMWTEGPRGSKTLRAQTYDAGMRPVGDALRVSPATGSFGQGTVAVVGSRAVVAFLLATGRGFELWGTVLQCG